MKRTDRLARLDEQLKYDGMLHLKRAASLLGVSEMTIRRDLQGAGGAFQYLGGYILPTQGRRNGIYRLDAESDAHADAKAAACRQAARLIKPDDTIFIDCGTTTPHLIAHLPTTGSLTVVCYALNIANTLARRPNVRLILLGGVFHASAETFFGEEAIRSLGHLGINHAILSAGGVDPSFGVTCSNFQEVPIKQAAMRRAQRRTLVVDASKLDRVKPAYFADMDAFDEIVTENGRLTVPIGPR